MGRLLLDAGFVYTAMIVPPRCRNAVAVKVLGTMAVAVRTMDPGETDVAFMHRFRNPFEDRKPWQPEAPEAARWREIHWDGNTLFRDRDPRGVEWEEDVVRHSVSTMNPNSPLWHVQTGGRRNLEAAVPRAQVAGRILSDDLERRMGAVREKAGRLALRGKSWVAATGEPVWETRRADGVPARVQVGLLEPDGDGDGDGDVDLTRADRREESLLWLPEGTRDPACVGGQIEVVIPWAVKAPVSTVMLARVVREAVKGERGAGGGRDLHYLPKEYILAWARVRDILPEIEAAPKGTLPPGAASLVGELAVAARACDGDLPRLAVAWEGWLLDNPDPGPSAPAPPGRAP